MINNLSNLNETFISKYSIFDIHFSIGYNFAGLGDYSYRNACTGLALAVLNVCSAMVKNARPTAVMEDSRKTSGLMPVRYVKPESQSFMIM